MTKLVLCKIDDELSDSEETSFAISAQAMDDKVERASCATRVRELFEDVKKRFPRTFGHSEKIRLDDDSISYVVNELQHFSLQRTKLDAVSAAFEVLMGPQLKGEKGEFFTPRPVVRAAIHMLLARQDTRSVEKVNFLDPAMGTAGFIKGFMEATEGRGIQTKVLGLDVEEDLVQVAKAYMAILGYRGVKLFNANTLKRPADWTTSVREELELASQDFLLTNPPFGSRIPIIDPEILAQYQLARKWTRTSDPAPNLLAKSRRPGFGIRQMWRPSNSSDTRPQVPDVLFLERCLEFLKPPRGGTPGGMMGIVLPRQILSGNDAQYVRQWLFNNSKVRAVIDLPVETFQPFTGTKTSLVFLQRGQPTEDYPIFMAVAGTVGHDRRGNTVFRRDAQGELRLDKGHEPIIADDLPELCDAYDRFLQGGKSDLTCITNVPFSRVQFGPDSPWGRLDASFYVGETEKLESVQVPEGWTTVLLGELADVFYPGRFKRTYVDSQEGIPFLSGNDATQLEPVNLKYISRQTPKLKDYLLKEGWVLVTRSGTVGIVVYVGKHLDGYAASEHLLRIVPDPKKVDPGYLFAFLSSDLGVTSIKRGTYGSVVDEVSPDYLRSLRIPAPPLSVQRRIGTRILAAQKQLAEAIGNLRESRREVLRPVSAPQRRTERIDEWSSDVPGDSV